MRDNAKLTRLEARADSDDSAAEGRALVRLILSDPEAVELGDRLATMQAQQARAICERDPTCGHHESYLQANTENAADPEYVQVTKRLEARLALLRARTTDS